MVKRILWKDIRQTLSGSIGRFVSIVCLMALGSFALVGLKVAGPDMQATGAEFYGRNNLADVTVVSTYGLSEDDKDVIGRADGVRGIEYGYFKDVVIKGTDSSMRVFSKPEYISTYDVVEGRMPKRQGEIVLDLNQRSAFAVGSTLDVTEKSRHLRQYRIASSSLRSRWFRARKRNRIRTEHGPVHIRQRHTDLIRRGHAVGIRLRGDDDRTHRLQRY